MGLKEKVVSGVVWSFAERFSAQLVSFAVSIVLARLIAPDAFGAIAMVLVFTNVLDTFATAGFGSALIQKKDADELDFSTVLIFNILFSCFLYVLLFFAAPYIAIFYNMPIIESVVQVIGIRVIMASINSVQRAYVSRQMQFKKFFYATFSGTFISAIIGLSLALYGWGIWSLVVQYLTGSFVGIVVLWLVIEWRPRLMFSFKRLKFLFQFGWKILGTNLLSTIYIELTDLIVGKMYNASSLAYYNRGKKFPQLVVTQINSSIDTVLFPAMSKHQDDSTKLKSDIRYSVQISSFCIFPIIFVLAVLAEDVIRLLLTDKWIESVIYLQIACISYALLPLSLANIQAIKAMGRSDIYLKLDIVKKIVGVSLLTCFFREGVVAIALADAVSNVIGLLVNVFPNRKLMNYSLKDLLQDVAPAALLTLMTCLPLCIIDNYLLIKMPLWIKLLLEMMVASAIYIGASRLTGNKTYSEIINIGKSLISKK